MKKLAFLLITFLFLASCATTEIGRPVNYDSVQKIEIGKTTKAEVQALLGEPVKQRESADGSELVYGHMKAQAHALPFYARGTAEGEKVAIKFNKRGIVTAVEKTRLQK